MSDSLKNTLSFIVYLPLIIVCLSVLGYIGCAIYTYRTTGNFRHIGSESGYVDPGTVMFGDSDEPVYDIRDIDDPMERSFKKHQKSIDALLNEINQFLRDN